jgi:NaMN:DMB phosphoribosyltransferase
MLAGGTQMSSILALLKSLDRSLERISIGTTVYVADDKSSNLTSLVNAISTDIRIYASDLHLGLSSHPGLQSFARGFVKEGVGAGGISAIAMMKSDGQIDGNILLNAIEHEYDAIISKVT